MKRCGLAVVLLSCLTSVLSAEVVFQSQRDIPVVRECDVVVVGGGSAAVAAAIAAQTNGASVTLLAPRNYLGEDIAGTRELWPEVVSESYTVQLAQDIFPVITSFSYTTDVTPNGSHPDPDNTRLADGVHYDAAAHSVQYDNDVQITCEFQGSGSLLSIDIYYFKRLTNRPFDTLFSSLQYSMDGQVWSSANYSTAIENIGMSDDTEVLVAHLTFDSAVQAQFVRLFCDIADGCERQLLDEIIFNVDPVEPVPGSRSEQKPLTVKKALQDALENAGVFYMGGSPVTDVIRDNSGNPAGVVVANRKGRQALRARVIIDATAEAAAAQKAGAVKRAFVPGIYELSRIVMADATNAPAGNALTVEQLPDLAFDNIPVSGVASPENMPSTINARIYRCTLATNLNDAGVLEMLEMEQALRDLTWVKTCIDQSDVLSWMPPDTIICESSESTASWTGAAQLDLNAFRPAGVTNVFLLGVRADIPRSLAANLLNPARGIALGERIGTLAATEALGRADPQGLTLPGDAGALPGNEDVYELLVGWPPCYTNSASIVTEGARNLPVIAECDVLVIGAGTSGAPAAIAAGRAGADTIAVEYLCRMGGVQTDGRIGSYCHGNACGFTTDDVDPGVAATGAVLATSKSEWYRRACREAGVRVLYGTMAAGVVMQDSTVKGIVVVLPDGQRAVIRAQAVVDATGNAVIAAMSGEETEFVKSSEIAVQGAGQGRHILGNSYKNSDVGFVDDRDVCDVFFFARRACASIADADAWDAGQNPASRERRRLVGVVTVSPLDILNNRNWPDTIVRPSSDFDSHGYTVHDVFFINDPGRDVITANLPYRALLPKTVDGLLVTGLGISAHRDAMPILRMQRDMQNQGYAAGYAAALAVQDQVTPRNVNLTALQSHLVAKNIIRAEDAGTPDSFPLPSSAIQQAVNGLIDSYATLHTVLTDVPTALPMLRSAYVAQSDPASKLIYAHVLGMLYDATGAQTLAAAVSGSDWDIGWNYRGMGQYGLSVSRMDSYIIALGRTSDPIGLFPVIGKTERLNSYSSFSHVRAVSLAFESLNSSAAMPALSNLLAQIEGHAITNNALTTPLVPGFFNTAGDTERNLSLKEISVARALFRLGDDPAANGARVLSLYASDPREIYADHARQVLSEGAALSGSDGEWIADSSVADWSDASNWRNGIIAQGVGSTAWFTNQITDVQTINLGEGILNIGLLVFAGGERVLTNGFLDINHAAPVVDVAEEASVRIASGVLTGQSVSKIGTGRLEISGATSIGGLDLVDGEVVLSDPSASFYNAYSSSPALCTPSEADFTALRCDFRVNAMTMITALGAYDSDGDGFESLKKVSIYNHGGGYPLAVLAFSPLEDYELDGGYRFRRLPQPLILMPGDYSVVTHGFAGNDRYFVGSPSINDGLVGELNDGGCLTFLPNGFAADGNDRVYPVDVAGASTTYPLTAGSFRFVTGASEKVIIGPVSVSSDALLDIASVKMTFADGLYPGSTGMGVVSNASAAHPVSLALGVAADVTNHLSGATLRHRSDGPLNLVKSGKGTLIFEDSLRFDGGLCVNQGLIEIDSPAALGGGDLCFDTGGTLLLNSGGTLDKTLYVASQSTPNNRTTQLQLASGHSLSLNGDLLAPRNYVYGGFVLQSFNNDSQQPTAIIIDGAMLNYFDLYLYGDGIEGGGAAAHVWRNVTGGLRKLASGNETSQGSTVDFTTGCDFSTDWFDVAGSNTIISISDNARISVQNQLRFVDGNASQLSLDGGFLDVLRFGVANAANQHLALESVLFNGTWIKALGNNSYFFNLSTNSSAPLICNGGALFNTDVYDVALRGRGFAQAPNSTGALVKDGLGILRIATPMLYSGATIVSNGILALDFALLDEVGVSTDNLLPPENMVLCVGGSLAVYGTLGSSGDVVHRQQLERLENTADSQCTLQIEQAALEINQLVGDYLKSGDGKLTVFSDTSEQAEAHGTITVADGTLELSGPRRALAFDLPYSGFESDPLLPDTVVKDKDKRGANASGCPGWTFVTTDSGYQRNGSYFSGNESSHAPEGVQTAFIMNNGAFNTTLAIVSNGLYTLRFQYCPRYYGGTWYTNLTLSVNLDGLTKDQMVVVEPGYLSREVDLGWLEAGSYTLSFNGDNSLAPDDKPCVLIDDVSVCG